LFCLSRKSNKSCKNRLKVPEREGFPPIILASFFKFIHVNVSAAFIFIRALPIIFVYRNPWYSLALPKILSIVSFRWSYKAFIPSVCRISSAISILELRPLPLRPGYAVILVADIVRDHIPAVLCLIVLLAVSGLNLTAFADDDFTLAVSARRNAERSFTFTVDVPGLQEKYLINHPDVNKDYLDFSCEINVSDGTISYDKAIFEGCTRGSFCLHYAVYTF